MKTKIITLYNKAKKEWKYFDLLDFLKHFGFRIIFIPSLIIMCLIVFPIAIISQIVIWFFTGNRFLTYMEDVGDWYERNIWDNVFK